MVYSVVQGIDSQFVPRVVRASALVLPLIAAGFLAVALLSFSLYSANGQNPYIAAPTKSVHDPKSQMPAGNIYLPSSGGLQSLALGVPNSGLGSTGGMGGDSTAQTAVALPAIDLQAGGKQLLSSYLLSLTIN